MHLKDDFKNIEEWVLSYSKEIDTLIFDHQLLENGYSIYFAIDSSCIYDFAFPYEGILMKYGSYENIDGLEKLKLLNREAGHVCIFYGLQDCGQPFLLPPHAVEIMDLMHLLSIKALRLLFKRENASPQHIMTTLIGEELMTEVSRKSELGPEAYLLDSELKEKLLSFSAEKFDEFILLLLTFRTNAIRVLSQLFENRRILFIDDYTDLLPLSEIKLSGEEIERLNNKFSKRHRSHKSSNLRDAVSITLLKSMNAEFVSRGISRRCFLISDAPFMNYAINGSKERRIMREELIPAKIDGREEACSLLRTSNTFQVYLFHKGIKNKDTLLNLRKVKNRINQYFTIGKLISELEELLRNGELINNQPKLESSLIESEKTIKELNDIKIKISNIRMAVRSEAFYKSYMSDTGRKSILEFNKKEPEATNLKSSIDNILLKLMKLSDPLEARLESLLNDMNNEISNLRESGFNILELASGGNRFNLSFLHKLTWVPFRVRFKNPKVLSKLSNLIDAVDNSNYQKQKMKLFSLMQLTQYRSISMAERELLSALLHLAFGDYRMALSSISGIEKRYENKSIYKEFRYLRCIIHYYYAEEMMLSIDNYDSNTWRSESINECILLYNQNEYDPRFPLFLSFIYGHKYSESRNNSSHTDLQSALHWASVALNVINRIPKRETFRSGDELMRASILNNLAYFSILRGNIVEAGVFIDNLKQLCQVEKWLPQYYDTCATYYIELAKLNIKNEKYLLYYGEAKSLLEKGKLIALTRIPSKQVMDQITVKLHTVTELIRKSKQ